MSKLTDTRLYHKYDIKELTQMRINTILYFA